jgi:hypothetical protein
MRERLYDSWEKASVGPSYSLRREYLIEPEDLLGGCDEGEQD